MVDLEGALLKLEPKEGDIIFFDLGAVDTKELTQLCEEPPEELAGVVFIGILLRHGQSAEDVVFHMSKTELDLLVADKAKEES